MNRKILTTNIPVVLVGYQAIMRPSRYGYLLECITNEEELIDQLEDERIVLLEKLTEELEKPRLAVIRSCPWIQLEDGWNLKFSWKEHSRPPVVDNQGIDIQGENFPLYAESQCQLAMYQIPYRLKNKETEEMTLGTTLKLAGIQIVSLGSGNVNNDVFSVDQARAVFFGNGDSHE